MEAYNCHTTILHRVSSLQSLYNVVIQRSRMLCKKARATGVSLICDIFAEAPHLSYTTFGFNALNYNRYIGEPTMMQIRCVQTLLEMSRCFLNRTEALLHDEI